MKFRPCFSLSQAKSMVKDLQHKHKTHANGMQPGFGQASTNHWSFQVYGGHWAATTFIYWTLSNTHSSKETLISLTHFEHHASFWPWILWLAVQSVLSSTREVAWGHTIHEHEDNYDSCIIMELLSMMWFSDQKWQKKRQEGGDSMWKNKTCLQILHDLKKRKIYVMNVVYTSPLSSITTCTHMTQSNVHTPHCTTPPSKWNIHCQQV
jgi:hypothetical protein